MENERKELIQAWLKKAENDLKAAEIIKEHGGDDTPFDTACFHCQQAAEKYLKAYCVYLEIDFPKTHLLSTLIDLISSVDKEVLSLEDANILSSYGVSIRYPDDFYIPSLDELTESYMYAEKIGVFVRNKIVM